MQLTTGLGPKKTGSPLYQYLATITGCLSIVCTGMHFGWPSPSLPQLFLADSAIQLTSDDGSWMAVMPCIGAASGSLIAAYIVDKIGRKTSMLITSPLYFISWIMVAFSPSVSLLNIARFLAGTSDGIAFTALPIYIGEIADSKIRGFLGASIPVTTTLGILLINIIGSYLDIKTTALISSAVPILHFCTFVFMPESPYYLLMKSKFDEAKRSLQILKGTEDVAYEVERLNDSVTEDLSQTGRIWDLFTVISNRRALIIVTGLRTVQQFSGINAITFYAKTIFHEAGSDISTELTTMTYFIVQLVVSILCALLVDKLGRRPLLIVSTIGSGFALAIEGVYFYLDKYTDTDLEQFKSIPIVALLGFVVIFNIGMGTIPVLMLGELFPTSVKAFALCLADIYFGALVTLVSKFFQTMKDNFGIYVPFLAFTVCCGLGLIFVVFWVPETKGKTLEEIQEELKGKEFSESNTGPPLKT